MKIPKKCFSILAQSHSANPVCKDRDFFAANQLRIDRVEDRFQAILDDLELKSYKGKRILAVGSGGGLLLNYFRTKGVEAYGIEPDREAINCSQVLSTANNISDSMVVESIGENLPFKSNSFDIVFSFQVLEHVQNPEKVLTEVNRLLKPEGQIYFVMPNYFSFWEGHYSVLWLPVFVFKPVAKLYLSLLGRDPTYVNELQFVNPFWLRAMCDTLNLEVKDYGAEKCRQYLTQTKIKDYWAANSLMFQLVSLIKKLGLHHLIAFVLSQTKTFYPICLIATKK